MGNIATTDWHRWYAWHPVKIDGKWRWREDMIRRLGASGWEYSRRPKR